MGQTNARQAFRGHQTTHRKGPRPRYYAVIDGRGFWQPNKRLRNLDFRNVACGADSPEARAIADRMNVAADKARDQYTTANVTHLVGDHWLCAWSAWNAQKLEREFEALRAQTQGQDVQTRVQTHQLERPRLQRFAWLGAPARYLSSDVADGIMTFLFITAFLGGLVYLVAHSK